MSDVARYAVAWVEHRRALASLISATERLASSAAGARAELRESSDRRLRVRLGNSDVVIVVGLRGNGDIYAREDQP